MRGIDRARLETAVAKEKERFAAEHPRSKQLFERAKKSLLAGVPMNWMERLVGGYPIFVEEASGAYFTDVDGHRYIDFCLGDTGAMTGHAPKPAVEAITERVKRGTTLMLPTEDSLWVGEELARRFGLPYWQVALTATDANRFSIRLARELTQRPYILVYNQCYHGSVDETLIMLEEGVAKSRKLNLGPPVDPTLTTKVVEFNDLEALEKALAPKDVACVLAEPVMTNIGIVPLLIIDETHTICTGPGGYTREHGLEPDILTLGKPIASGVPAAVYGFTSEVAGRIRSVQSIEEADTSGIGGTLAGNALSLAAMRATLQSVLTQEAYDQTIPLAERFTDGVEGVINNKELPWHIARLGCRAEYWFCPKPPRNGGEAAAAVDELLDYYMHLAALNRGILMTPFHNMALIAPGTKEADIDLHTRVFRESVEAIL
jgi:glutamate-1-semialdehyde 2,1-aminomutase